LKNSSAGGCIERIKTPGLRHASQAFFVNAPTINGPIQAISPDMAGFGFDLKNVIKITA